MSRLAAFYIQLGPVNSALLSFSIVLRIFDFCYLSLHTAGINAMY